MPYIKKEQRVKLIQGELIVPDNAGELNFIITKLLHAYIDVHGENYQNYNDILGALEGAKLELYRRQVASYEDKKIKENGDL